jgi:hypothetical protein
MLITYLPFIGFTSGFAGPNRYLYLPSIGFSVLLAGALIWLIEHLPLIRARVVLVGGLLTILWIYNMVPLRMWQGLMESNSNVRTDTFIVIEDHLVPSYDITEIYLSGYPPKFRDLTRAIKLFYGIEPVWVDPANPPSDPPGTQSLIIAYDNGRVAPQEVRFGKMNTNYD